MVHFSRPPDNDAPSEADVIAAVRQGDIEAYGVLCERHADAAHNHARQCSRSVHDANDLVQGALEKVLRQLLDGEGPDPGRFRAYLCTTVRHLAYDKTRRDRRTELSDDIASIPGCDVAIVDPDSVTESMEHTLAARAFAQLPHRWQEVIQLTTVEGRSPAEIAPRLGLTPNSVSALALRAREGLRQAYLQMHHHGAVVSDRCRATAGRLGPWLRNAVGKAESEKIEAHLHTCDACRYRVVDTAATTPGLVTQSLALSA